MERYTKFRNGIQYTCFSGRRYQVRRIADGEMTELDSQDSQVVIETESLADAEEWAAGVAAPYGAAIIDFENSTVDWGHCTTRAGDPALPVKEIGHH